MAIKILMPALSPTMVSGNVSRWIKKEGDIVKPGEIIAEIETDKATMEVESADAGILGKIVIAEGSQDVKVNTVIAVLLESGEDASSIELLVNEVSSIEEYKTETEAAEVLTVREEQAEYHHERNNKVFATPLAKRIAKEKGIDLSKISGSGPRGRVVKKDVSSLSTSYVSKTRNSKEYEVLPLTQMRKTIAKRLQDSKLNAPHFYLSVDCRTDAIDDARNYINAKARITSGKPEYKISINDFVIKAVAQALQKNPNANAGWSDEGILLYNNVDISIAVAIDDGLITPILQNADHKSLIEISNEVKELASRAKQNLLKPNEFMGGSFTISNLGMYGIKEFKAIVNPPQACILAVGKSEPRAIVVDGSIVVAEMMTVSLSCDHRVVDGAVAAEFLADFKAHIEQPVTMFI